MRLCARRVSGAAHREQRCGLVVMDGWRPGAFRILGAGADEPQTREGRVGVSLGEDHPSKNDGLTQISASGLTAILLLA